MNTVRLVPLYFHIAQRPFGAFHFCHLPKIGTIAKFEDMPDTVLGFVNKTTGKHEYVAIYVTRKDARSFAEHAASVVGSSLITELVGAMKEKLDIDLVQTPDALHPSFQQYLNSTHQPGPFQSYTKSQEPAKLPQDAWTGAMGNALASSMQRFMSEAETGMLAHQPDTVSFETSNLKLTEVVATNQVSMVKFNIKELRGDDSHLQFSKDRYHAVKVAGSYGPRNRIEFRHAGYEIVAVVQCNSMDYLSMLMNYDDLVNHLKDIFDAAVVDTLDVVVKTRTRIKE